MAKFQTNVNQILAPVEMISMASADGVWRSGVEGRCKVFDFILLSYQQGNSNLTAIRL